MNKELKEQVHKEFDDRFTTRDWSGTKKLNMFCVTNKTKESPIFGEDEEELVAQHKLFIDSLIDKTVQRTKEQMENELSEWKDSYKGKLWSTAVEKCFKAPFIEVAIQYLLKRIDEKHQEELKKSVQMTEERIVGIIEDLEIPLNRELGDTPSQGYKKSKDDIISLITNKSNINNNK